MSDGRIQKWPCHTPLILRWKSISQLDLLLTRCSDTNDRKDVNKNICTIIAQEKMFIRLTEYKQQNTPKSINTFKSEIDGIIFCYEMFNIQYNRLCAFITTYL